MCKKIRNKERFKGEIRCTRRRKEVALENKRKAHGIRERGENKGDVLVWEIRMGITENIRRMKRGIKEKERGVIMHVHEERGEEKWEKEK
jgi:hypothetical protein